jgi:hypothetical protein
VVTLSIDELKALLRRSTAPCVSIYLPTGHPATDPLQSPIRLENLLRVAQERLEARGLDADKAGSLLEPMQTLVRDRRFWQEPGRGIVLYAAPQLFHTLRLPIVVDELVWVGERPHIRPLLPLFSGNGRFFILALSKKQVRLLHGTRDVISEVDLAGVPAGLADALRYDEFERELQLHHGASVYSGGPGPIYHGHGSTSDVEKEETLRYFQQVDHGLHAYLRGEQAPLVLAGVAYLLPIYRAANTYAHLVDGGMIGNPDRLSAEELHLHAWELVQPFFDRARQDALMRYRAAAASGPLWVSSYARVVVPAAYQGRVETLFLTSDRQLSGTFDQEAGALHVYDDHRPGADDLLDATAAQTILHGGSVYTLPAEQVPDGGLLAALLRY